MNYKEYINLVSPKCPDMKEITIGGLSTMVFYEEFFKWEWLATKLKIFSFISYVDKIDENGMNRYSEDCIIYAKKNKRGLPVGLQNGIISNNVYVSEKVDHGAITFASSRPRKHFGVFELPVIVDLARKELYYYRDEIVWGAMYSSFIKGYIDAKFSIISR